MNKRHCKLCGKRERITRMGVCSYSNLTEHSQLCAECVNKITDQESECKLGRSREEALWK